MQSPTTTGKAAGQPLMRLLVLNFFPALVPPASGGMLRYFHMYERLSKRFSVTLLSLADDRNECIRHSATFREYRVQRHSAYHQIYAQVDEEGFADEYSALVSSLAARYPGAYHHAYLELQADADCIVHEFPYMAEYDLLLGRDGRPRIYNSHNLEAELVAQMWRGPHAAKYVAHVARLERSLIEASGQCFSVSGAEAARFCARYGVPAGRFAVAENGAFMGEFRRHWPRAGNCIRALFFGSFHRPNFEAARFIIDAVAPACPRIDFIIAGNCVAADGAAVPANVQLLGTVDDATRIALFAHADIGLNPMFSGSGTNLKALEYLAAGMPMLTTGPGARGLGLTDGEDAVFASAEEFACALRALAADRKRAARIAQAGREYVRQRFSWEAIGARTADTVARYLADWTPPTRRHLLVLNDASVASPQGLSETRIHRMFSALGETHDVTLVCLTSGRAIERMEIAPGFSQIGIPKTPGHRHEERLAGENAGHAWREAVLGVEASRNALLVNIVAALHRHVDAVVLCHAGMSLVLADLRGVPVVLDASPATLAATPVRSSGSRLSAASIEAVVEAARDLAAACEATVVESADQRDALIALGMPAKRVHLIANGFDAAATPIDAERAQAMRSCLGQRPVILYCTDASLAASEATRFVTIDLAAQLPEVAIVVVGSVGVDFPPAPANVALLGALDHEATRALAGVVDIAVHPFGAGGGGALADVLAHGAPVVTTSAAAQGLAALAEGLVVHCEMREFAVLIRALLRDPTRINALRAAAVAFARSRPHWDVQALAYSQMLESAVFEGVNPRRARTRARAPVATADGGSAQAAETPIALLNMPALRAAVDVPGFVDFIRRDWERRHVHDEEFRHLQLTGRSMDHILDIGANMGQSIVSLRCLFPQAHIRSYEANPLLYPVLQAVAEVVPGPIEVFDFGLGSRNRHLSLFVPCSNWQYDIFYASTVIEYYSLPWVAQTFRERGGISLAKLPTRIVAGRSLDLAADLIKIDVEGAELDVIAGLMPVIERDRPVIFAENSDFVGVTRFLRDFGYLPFQAAAGGRALVRIDAWPWPINTIYLHESTLGAATIEGRAA